MSDQPITNIRTCYRFDGSRFESVSADVASEFAITVYVNDEEFATMVCTPSDLEKLVVGFLASEGVIAANGEIDKLIIDTDQGYAYVDLLSRAKMDPSVFSKRRITSCCGKSRQSYYFASDAFTVRPVSSGHTITPEQIVAWMEELTKRSDIHRLTGGVHSAGLCGPDGLIMLYSDIGRHNALDKIYGACLMQQLSVTDKPLVISGRISSEMVLKAAKIGSPVLLSKAAPTDLAIRLAEELGITTVGFIRGGVFNVYTHPMRITGVNPL